MSRCRGREIGGDSGKKIREIETARQRDRDSYTERQRQVDRID